MKNKYNVSFYIVILLLFFLEFGSTDVYSQEINNNDSTTQKRETFFLVTGIQTNYSDTQKFNQTVIGFSANLTLCNRYELPIELLFSHMKDNLSKYYWIPRLSAMIKYNLVEDKLFRANIQGGIGIFLTYYFLFSPLINLGGNLELPIFSRFNLIIDGRTLILSRFSGQQVKTKNYLIQIAPVIDNR
jgi:hypothetical protein